MVFDEKLFQTYKATAVICAFSFSALCQFAFPYRKSLLLVLKNWRLNLSLGIFNGLILYFACGTCVCEISMWASKEKYGLFNWLSLGDGPTILASVVLLDFVAFIWHRANHRLPLLWRFHRLHHTDIIFDASTAVRFHPVELVISLALRILVVVSFGIPIMGLIVFEMLYAGLNFWEHGNIRIPPMIEKPLQVVLVTPAWHRFHHSVLPSEHNRNFATIFAFWDRLWGTHLLPGPAGPKSIGL